MPLPLFGGAGELGQADHRHIQLLRHDFEVPGHLGNLLHPVFNPRPGGHQLQIVDDNEPQVFEPPHLRLHLGDGDAGGVVHIDMGAREPLGGDRQLLPLLLLEVAGAHLIRRDQRVGTEHTGDQLGIAHLQREDRDIEVGVLHPDVCRDV